MTRLAKFDVIVLLIQKLMLDNITDANLIDALFHTFSYNFFFGCFAKNSFGFAS